MAYAKAHIRQSRSPLRFPIFMEKSSLRVRNAIPIKHINTETRTFLSCFSFSTTLLIKGVNTTVIAQRKPEFDKLVYFTPKVAPMYTNTSEMPTRTLYLRVILFTFLTFFHVSAAAIKNAPRNLWALRVNGSISARLISIR